MEAASRPKVSTADNAEVATKLADCYLQISAEGRRVFEDPDLRVEAPLHSSFELTVSGITLGFALWR